MSVTTISYEEFDSWKLGKKSDDVDFDKIAGHLDGKLEHGRIIVNHGERQLELAFQFLYGSGDNHLAYFTITVKNTTENKEIATFSYIESKNPYAKVTLRRQYINDDNLVQLPAREGQNYVSKREQITTTTAFVTIETLRASVSIWPDASFNITSPPRNHRWQ